MATVLAIKGHPLTSQESNSVTVMEAFLKKYQATHPEDKIEMVDVFNDTDLPEIDTDMAEAMYAMKQGKTFEELTESQQTKLANYDKYTAQFLAADKIVIANPLWNLNIPTRLKVWIDTICVSGKTFRYTAQGPVGLVTDKKALHIQSNGGTYLGQDHGSQYVSGMLRFLGLADVDQLFIEGVDHHPEKKAEIMAEIINQAETKAINF